MNIRDDVAGKYVNDLLSLEYKQLNDSQKQVFDLIKQMLPKIWETDFCENIIANSTQQNSKK